MIITGVPVPLCLYIIFAMFEVDTKICVKWTWGDLKIKINI